MPPSIEKEDGIPGWTPGPWHGLVSYFNDEVTGHIDLLMIDIVYDQLLFINI